MKKLFPVLILFLLTLQFTACSKCYECVETVEILDSNGNVIDTTVSTANICTADTDEIKRREADGAICSN